MQTCDFSPEHICYCFSTDLNGDIDFAIYCPLIIG